MKPKLFRVLLAFVTFNIVGVVVFYGWVLSQQTRSSGSKRSFIQSHGDVNMALRNSALPTKGRSGDATDGLSRGFQQRGVERLITRAPSKNKVPVADGGGGPTLKPPGQTDHGNLQKLLANLPPVPAVSKSDDVVPINSTILRQFQSYEEREAKERVLILSPIHDVSRQLRFFLRLLQSLTYPHLLVAVAFGEDSSHDNTLGTAHQVAEELRKSFRRVDVFHLNLTGQVNGSWSNVHRKDNQLHRRRHLAQARNALWRAARGDHPDHDWVLWIDSDVTDFPPAQARNALWIAAVGDDHDWVLLIDSDISDFLIYIVQQLQSANRDVVVPLCVYQDRGRKRVFDKNTWRETKSSLAHLKELPDDTLMVEGYDTTKRLWLSDLRAEGRVVPIDGVGGCVLMVRSQCFEKGLVFPEEIFQHHIETEGLAKMATSMGFGVFGMPFVEVFH